MQEKENHIEVLNDKQHKNEQELAILSDEVRILLHFPRYLYKTSLVDSRIRCIVAKTRGREAGFAK